MIKLLGKESGKVIRIPGPNEAVEGMSIHGLVDHQISGLDGTESKFHNIYDVLNNLYVKIYVLNRLLICFCSSNCTDDPL